MRQITLSQFEEGWLDGTITQIHLTDTKAVGRKHGYITGDEPIADEIVWAAIP